MVGDKGHSPPLAVGDALIPDAIGTLDPLPQIKRSKSREKVMTVQPRVVHVRETAWAFQASGMRGRKEPENDSVAGNNFQLDERVTQGQRAVNVIGKL
ncbi:hypothetical protein GLAREA_10857 [Glarea lozoyensis ATCC 20868]|uniref:Uncharacterized protein n=1 Tax=Glarea lozoyensis (strain ATCC 20868 / MF5171) TaxID=1116229 RepID=S3DT71_GLAL2|nr:uncharacterized protein GLAREA_10857 [Glarea lozoyensis ATCC 20868]EPE35161.1 hypothetical protein GLAREA_10857 [Glarea lozoyensis ATCC 20868]